MSIVKKGASVGAAAFAMGIYLAVPQPVATADDSGNDNPSVSANARNSGPERSTAPATRAGRAPRSATSSGPTAPTVTGPAIGAQAAVTQQGVPAAAASRRSGPRSQGPSSKAAEVADSQPSAVSEQTAVMPAALAADVGTKEPASAAVSARTADSAADEPTAVVSTPLIASAATVPAGTASSAAVVSTNAAAEVAAPVARAVVAAPTNPLAAVDTAVQNWFSSVADWLSDMPDNPVSDWAEGALLLVRRTLFNSAPTATSTQYATLANGTIVGRIEVSDAEGDQVTYSVTTDPTRGSVAVDSTGMWTYKPNSSYQGSDTFTVTVGQITNGINILNATNMRGLTTAQAGVASTSNGLVTSTYTQGFNITNLTTRTLKLTNISQPDCWNCSQDGNPMQNPPYIGMQLKPGETMRFEQVFKSFQANMAEVSFEAVNDPYQVSSTVGRWKTHTTVAPGNYLNMNDCDSSGGSCSTNSGASTYYLMDPSGTEVTFAPNDAEARQKMALALNQLCSSSAARCSFTPPNGQDLFQDRDVTKGYTAPQVRAIFRNGEGNFTFKKTVGQTVTESSSIGVSADASASIFGIVQASVSSNYSSSVSKENTFSDEITKEVPANTTLVISQQYPTIDITGDFDIRLGSSIIHLHNVTFTTPDPSRAYITAYDTFANGDPSIPQILNLPVDTPSLISPPYLAANPS